MKKLVAIIIVICLIFVGVVGCSLAEKEPVPTQVQPVPVDTEELQPGDEPTGGEVDIDIPVTASGELDFDAMYASHEPDEIVLTVGGRDVTWGEYFCIFFSQASLAQDIINVMSMYYGVGTSWNSIMSEDIDMTYAQYVPYSTEQTIMQFQAIRAFAQENGIEITDKDLAGIEKMKAEDIEAACGQGATETDIEDYLARSYLTHELYDDIISVKYLYQHCFNELYGENGELFDGDEAVKYLEDKGYISANHILLMTIDPNTGEELDEAARSEKEAQAKQIAQELQGISDQQELLARFAELKEQYCEDSGKDHYPDGYVFTPGTMVAEFEDACNALDAYQVSEPVKSSYGYHIILRLPSDADRVVDYSYDGTPLSARAVAANEEYGSRMEECLQGIYISYAPDFVPPAISDYLK